MAKISSIKVNERKTAGKGAARAERRAGLIPGVVYGEKKEPVMFSISALDLDAQMRQKGFWTRQFEIEIGKNKYHAICQDVQTHPITDRPIHVDFLRVSENTELQIEVPVLYENELACPGIKLGGSLNAIYRTIVVVCKPKDIPENLAVDLTGLKINDAIKMSDIKFPAGVKPVEAMETTIASITAPSSMEEAIPAAAAAATTTEAAAPAAATK
ncbi:MAG: 50S ribosomal protein L25/general stress protein Ctc [Alphaproteobacteria bacterium]|nr:50S ribosomal protein L25/general stress protein Ctc [Alphaproteobacteria bacterium]